MSLSRALAGMSLDESSERALHDVLALFEHHERQWMTESEIQTRTGDLLLELRPLIRALADAFVLEADEQHRYRFNGDVAVKYEIDAFMRRVNSHQSHMRTNVERFRERNNY